MNHRYSLVLLILLAVIAAVACGSDAPPVAPDPPDPDPPPPPPITWNGPYYLPEGWKGIWKEDACVMNGCGRPTMCLQTPPFPLCPTEKLFIVIENPDDWDFEEIVVTDHEIRLSAVKVLRGAACTVTTTVYYEAVRDARTYESYSLSEAVWTGTCEGSICRETTGFGWRLSTDVGQNCNPEESASISSFLTGFQN